MAFVLAGALTVGAQDYPKKQVLKIIVPFPPGGGIDVVARLIAPRLSEKVGQTVVVENRAGAGGSLGTAAAAQAAPDGYTILLGSGSTMGSNVVVYSKLPYHPARNFAPVVLISESPFLLVSNPDLPVKIMDRSAPAATAIWLPSCSTPWQRSRRTISRIAGPRRRSRT